MTKTKKSVTIKVGIKEREFDAMGKLANKVALVTGGLSGIGLATVKKFLDEGANVVIGDINEELSKSVMEKLPEERVAFVKLDVTKEDSWKNAVTLILDRFGKLNILVNNAGIGKAIDIEHGSLEDWNLIIDINLTSVFLGTKYGIKTMKLNDEGNSIINISSMMGLVSEPSTVAYSASKGGVRLLSKSAALYAAQEGYNIRVNSVHPGYVETTMLPGEALPVMKQLNPIKRLGRPEELANLISYLGSDESSYSTGSEFVADGGYTAQ